MVRSPAFAELDALILAGWGDVPQVDIPANWRVTTASTIAPAAPLARHQGILEEIREQELARVEWEETASLKDRVSAIRRADTAGLVEQVMENAKKWRRRPTAVRIEARRQSYRVRVAKRKIPRALSCDCGQCRTCYQRNLMRKRRGAK